MSLEPKPQPKIDSVPKKDPKIENAARNERVTMVLYEITEKLLDSESDPHLLALNDFMHGRVVFVDYLKSKYPNAMHYIIMHILIGSTPRPDSQTMYGDFPGDDSIEKYVEGLLKKYK